MKVGTGHDTNGRALQERGTGMAKKTGEFEVQTDLEKRTVYTRLTGLLSEEDVRAWTVAYRRDTDRFQGRKHMVIADMRGMKALHPDVAAIMGAEIGYARRHGVVLCAHISDD